MTTKTFDIQLFKLVRMFFQIYMGSDSRIQDCMHTSGRSRTDGSTLQGVEKLAVTSPDSAFLEGSYNALPRIAEGLVAKNIFVDLVFYVEFTALSGEIPPFSVGYIKGWRRSVTALITAAAVQELHIPFEDLTGNYKVGNSESLTKKV